MGRFGLRRVSMADVAPPPASPAAPSTTTSPTATALVDAVYRTGRPVRGRQRARRRRAPHPRRPGGRGGRVHPPPRSATGRFALRLPGEATAARHAARRPPRAALRRLGRVLGPVPRRRRGRGEIRPGLDHRQAGEWIVRLLLSFAVMPPGDRRPRRTPPPSAAFVRDHLVCRAARATRGDAAWSSPCSTRSRCPRPWGPDSERLAYEHTLEQAVAGERSAGTPSGPSSTTSSRSTRTARTPRCSTAPSRPAPSGSASATASGSCPSPTTTRCAPPSRWPCSTSSPAGGSTSAPAGPPPAPSSRASASTPHQTRAMWQEAIGMSSAAGPTTSTSSTASTGRCPSGGCCPSRCRSRTRRCGARPAATTATAQVGSLGLGLCSFAVGVPPEEVKPKIDIYREAVRRLHDADRRTRPRQAATFTMALCAPDRDEAWATARESFEWYPKTGARQIAHASPTWMAERKQDLGNYGYAADLQTTDDEGLLDLLTLEYLAETAPACSARPTTASRRAGATRRPASTCCCAWSTRTRSRTRRSCRPSS